VLFSALSLPHATLGEDGQEAIAKLDHLLQAATHLEKAGRTDLAAEIYAQLAAEAEVDRQRLAEAKLVEIERLQTEVARLRTPSPAADQVLIRLKVIELSLEKLAASGLGLVSIRNLLDSNASSAVPDEDGQISEFLELLRREGLVQVVAEPELVTVSGRPAALEVGSLAAPDLRAEPPQTGRPAVTLAGLRFACTPKITAPGRLSLELKFRRQTPVGTAGPGDRGADPQVAGSLEVRTVVELRSGKPLVLAGPRQSGGTKGSSATLLLVTATIVGAQGPSLAP
jgi:Flp pilus assembly secretin CpaC